MTNPYLAQQRAKYEALTASIQGVQTRAAEENRDLTDVELRSVTEQAEQASKLADVIEQLADVEVRAKKTRETAAALADDGEPETRSARVTTQDRDPGHYRSEKDGGRHSFFSDHYRSKVLLDREANTRLAEHLRSVNVDPNGAGIVPPRWLTDEYQAAAYQQRAVADRVRKLDLGQDPRPLILPGQTKGTAPISKQAAEGKNNGGWGSDKFATGTKTLTPEMHAEYQDVSRQLLDSSSPAVDALIMTDLALAWGEGVETAVCEAILADGTAAGTVFADETAFAAGAIDGVIDAQTAVAEGKRGLADLVVVSYKRFGAFRKLKDNAGRNLMPVSRYNPQNANGALGNSLVGDIEGSDVVATTGVPSGKPEKYAVLKSNAVLLAESGTVDFSYDQIGGPSFVRVGIWGYLGVLVRNPELVSVSTVTGATDAG
ncbi:phage major capsid protein [Amycolatopsis echigonensis]|uniref:Phage major capsid protein n=1 Tax=Amycolatopsis echigonensis TaxID=2576905 RepID=A0A8E1W2V2_9PSEU|nr:phage major capsid protein [Amycolatopsis echigonensis]MBB2502942.1 phage major capsid protein [Amycolatopsis echigonensis]